MGHNRNQGKNLVTDYVKKDKSTVFIPRKNVNPIILKKLNIAKSDIDKVFGEA